MTLRRALRSHNAFSIIILYGGTCAPACCFVFWSRPCWLSPIIDLFQELKIEGEQPEVQEEDNLDLMLPTKKKKSKKVGLDESDALDKDDGENN